MISSTPCTTRHGSCFARHHGTCRTCSYGPQARLNHPSTSYRTKLKFPYAYPYLLLDGFEDHISRPNNVASRGYFAGRDASMHNSNPGSPFTKRNPNGNYLQSPPSVSIEDLKRSEMIAEACLRYLIDSSKLPCNDQSAHQCPPDDQILREIRQGTWIFHYRFAESFSDSLVGLLDEYLQIWVLDEFKSEIPSQAGNCQSFKWVRSPLHFCAAFGCERLGNMYLQMGYNPNLIAHGQTPLHLAAAGGQLTMIKLLLGKCANIEARTVATGRTALLLAAFRGHGEAVKLLLEHGADVDNQDNHELTPNELASAGGYDQIATFILGLKLGRMNLTAGRSISLSRNRTLARPSQTKSPTALQCMERKLQTRPKGRSYRLSDSCLVSWASFLSPRSVRCQAGPESTRSNHSSCSNCGHNEGANCDQENTDEWVEVGSDYCDESS
jgi:hypothetical protein